MSQRGNGDSPSAMDRQAIVVDELECADPDRPDGYQVENFKYHVFSGTTSSIPPLTGSTETNRWRWNHPAAIAQRLVERVKTVPIRAKAVDRCKQLTGWHWCIGILGCLLALCFLIIIGIQWNKLYHEQWYREHQCVTKQCLYAASELHGRLNRSYQPCDNFYQYACGLHFRAHHPTVNADSPTAQGRHQYSSRLDRRVVMQLNEGRKRELLRIHRPSIDHLTDVNVRAIISGLRHISQTSLYRRNSAKLKVAEWFRSCASRMIRNWFGNREFFRRAVPALGGIWLLDATANNETGAGSENSTVDWPTRLFHSSIMTKQVEMSTNWSWFDAVKKLHKELHVPVFMDFSLSWKNSEHAKILIVPDPGARIGRYISKERKNYVTQLMQLVANEAGIAHGDLEIANRTKILVEDVILVMTHLYNIYFRSYEERKEVRIDVLNAKGTEFNWVGVLSDYFDQVDNRITERTSIQTNYLQYLQSVSPLIAEFKRNYTEGVFNRIMNNYMWWRVIESYAWHLSYEFSSLHENRHKLFESDLELDCFMFTHEIFSPVLGAIYVANHLNDAAVNQTKTILKYIKPGAKKQLDSLYWMDSVTKNRIHDRIDKMKFISDIPEIMRNDAKLDYAYRDVKISYVYISNLLSVVEYMRGVYNRILAGIAEPHENSELRNNLNVYDTKIGIDIRRDELYIPLGALQPPVYHHTLPAAMNFAGIGSMVGSAMAKLLGESGAYKFDGNIIGLWTQDSWEQYVKHWDCVQQRLGNNTQKYFNVSGLIMDFISSSVHRGADEVMDEASGLNVARLAFDLYSENERTSTVNSLLPGPRIPRDKLFYIAYTQTFCDKIDELQEWWRMVISEGSVPLELLLNQILSEEPNFAKTFECPTGSPMHPKTQCSAIF